MSTPNVHAEHPADHAGTCPGSCALHAALTVGRWNPYVVGALIGVLSWVTFAGLGKALGTSTTISAIPGAAVGTIAPQHVINNAYWAKQFNPPRTTLFDWQFFLVLALPFGALLARKLSSDPSQRHFHEAVPPLWRHRFGHSRVKRYAAAFIGGAIMLFGARMAGGCTSGHGISGGLQLAVSSWAFFLAMFASGLVTAFALFGKDGRNHV